MNCDIVEWFGDYVEIVVVKFGDCVKYWMIFNELFVIFGFGYYEGMFVLGLKFLFGECLWGVYYLLMVYGCGV